MPNADIDGPFGLGLRRYQYPLHERILTVRQYGRICLGRRKLDLSTVLAGQKVAIHEEDNGIRQVNFMHDEIGNFDLENCRLEPVDKPFGAKVLTMSPV